jgi:hypothetical protein
VETAAVGALWYQPSCLLALHERGVSVKPRITGMGCCKAEGR